MEKTPQLSTTMRVHVALFKATMFCDYCSIDFKVEKMATVINLGSGPRVIVPEFHCPKCGNDELFELPDED